MPSSQSLIFALWFCMPLNVTITLSSLVNNLKVKVLLRLVLKLCENLVVLLDSFSICLYCCWFTIMCLLLHCRVQKRRRAVISSMTFLDGSYLPLALLHGWDLQNLICRHHHHRLHNESHKYSFTGEDTLLEFFLLHKQGASHLCLSFS